MIDGYLYATIITIIKNPRSILAFLKHNTYDIKHPINPSNPTNPSSDDRQDAVVVGAATTQGLPEHQQRRRKMWKCENDSIAEWLNLEMKGRSPKICITIIIPRFIFIFQLSHFHIFTLSHYLIKTIPFLNFEQDW